MPPQEKRKGQQQTHIEWLRQQVEKQSKLKAKQCTRVEDCETDAD